jgi:2-methylcitrate dehydratase PrpD
MHFHVTCLRPCSFEMTSSCDLTSNLVAEMRKLATSDLPDDVANIAKLCILDWFAVTIAGSHEPLVQMLLDEIPLGGAGACALIGHSGRAAPVNAALINGAAGDALDYSDCIRAMNGHATATVLPAALATAEDNGKSGIDLLRAFVIGVETACRVAAMAGTGVLATAFHPTAVFGPFGSAAAAAHLMRLDDAQWRSAFAIAGSMAAGLASAAGTMCKPLHAGTAAANGLFAARLARRGVSGHPAVLEGPQGFLAAHSATPQPLPDDCRERFFIRETLVKRHAACQLAHGSIENILRIKESTIFAVEDIKQVRLGLAASSLRVCDIAVPRTGSEAKFSVRTLAAMALLGLPTDRPETFNDALIRSSDVLRLRDRITVDGRPERAVELSVAEVELKDGRVLTAQTDERELDLDLDRRRERVVRKFFNLTGSRLGRDAIARFQAGILDLESTGSIRLLLQSLETSLVPFSA